MDAIVTAVVGGLVLLMLGWLKLDIDRLGDKIDRMVDRISGLTDRVSHIEGRFEGEEHRA